MKTPTPGLLGVSALICALLTGVPAAADACRQLSVEARGVAFGTYDPADDRPLETHGEIQVSCLDPGGEPPAAEISLSAGSSGHFAVRDLAMGSESLHYNLYLDPGRTIVWGDGSGPSATVGTSLAGPGAAGARRSYPIYGKIFARQAVPSGAYADVIVVTIMF